MAVTWIGTAVRPQKHAGVTRGGLLKLKLMPLARPLEVMLFSRLGRRSMQVCCCASRWMAGGRR